MSRININNRTYSGNSVVITNGKVIVDGKDVTPEKNEREINIIIEGNIDDLNVDACNKLSVNGNVGSVKTLSGDVDVDGYVSGSVSTMSGDVDCGNVNGSVSTMSGDIKHRSNSRFGDE